MTAKEQIMELVRAYAEPKIFDLDTTEISHALGMLAEDAARYRWICDQKKMSLQTDGMTWLRDGVQFSASHRLSANGTQYGAYATLDQLIDAARDTS